MKALTLYQPWASAIAAGIKRIETRSWRTHYRGPLAIHAAKGVPKSIKIMPEYGSLCDMVEKRSGRLAFSAIVATCRLVECVPTSALRGKVNASELMFGDYGDGRFGWVLEDVKPIDPIWTKGNRGLWDVELPMD